MTRLYRCTRDIYKYDLTGQGAYLYGGRWNNKGTRLVYTASNASLAMLELLVHIRPVLPSVEYVMITLECTSDSVFELKPEDLPANWFQNPAPGTCRLLGDRFIIKNEFLLFKLPSSVIRQEHNYLINPHHKDFEKVKIISIEPIQFDTRLF